jgi:hypothetical protein
VWNGERFLADAIESITSQTLEALELIVVDDGSVDQTRSIALRFAQRDPRVRVMARAHAGIAQALNSGIGAARGRYIARMDADDYSLPSRLRKQRAFLDANARCVVVGCDLEVIDEDGEPIGVMRLPERHPDIADALLAGRNALAHPAVMMRTAAILHAGGYRADHFPCEDLDLWLRLSAVGEFANIPEALVRYRRHVNAVCVRERVRQVTTSAAILQAARSQRGLRPLSRMRMGRGANSTAIYHLQCATTALKAGIRTATFRHARATFVSAPWWPPAYAVLAACALPARAVPLLTRAYARFRPISF